MLGYEDLAAGRHDLPPGFDVIAFDSPCSTPTTVWLHCSARPSRGLLAPGGAVVVQTLHPDALGPDAAGWQVEDFAAFEAVQAGRRCRGTPVRAQAGAPWSTRPA